MRDESNSHRLTSELQALIKEHSGLHFFLLLDAELLSQLLRPYTEVQKKLRTMKE